MRGLPIDEATRRALVDAQAKAAAQATAGTGASHGALVVLRPEVVSEQMPDAEVLKFVSSALGATVDSVAKEMAAARGFDAPVASVFSADVVQSAITDWVALHKEALASDDAAKHAYGGPPASWEEAAQRMSAVVESARRARVQRGNAAASPEPSARVTDELKAGLFKTVASAGKVDLAFAAGGDMLTAISTMDFARAESIATRGETPLTEVRRLVGKAGAEGEAAFAYIFSAGSAKGSIPKGVATSVVDARTKLLVWLESQIETLVGDKRIDDVSDQINALASAILCVRATKDGKADETTCLYPLAVRLLGGTLPADEDGTDNDTVGQGTWGVRTGTQSVVDIPAAMASLSRLLAAVHGIAGGGAMGTGHAAGADGFGLTAMARRVCGALAPDKVEEAMLFIFTRAQNAMARLRTRAGAPRLDWPALVKGLLEKKVMPLINEQRAEGAARRELLAQGGSPSGRKSPRRDQDETEQEAGGPKKLSKRAQKKADWVEAKRAQSETGKDKKPAPPGQPKDKKPTPAGAPAKVPGLELAPSSITCLASKANHNGAVEALTKLYVARNPTRWQRETQPCPFVAIRDGPDAPPDTTCRDGATVGKCAQCDGWRSMAPADRVPYAQADVAAVKAACRPDLQKIFAKLSLEDE